MIDRPTIAKAKYRSRFRLWCGRWLYTSMRYLVWYFGRIKFARKRVDPSTPYTCFEHQTLLLRPLKEVDMQYQHNKITNLKLAAKHLDGVVLRPGEVLSYWKLIGRPTRIKGYLKGIVLCSGRFKPGMGGGLCQMSNLIYWMTLHTPLSVVERYRHSYDVFPDANRTQPFGSGATCVYPYRDLMIANPTQSTFRLEVSVGEHYLRGKWLSDTPLAVEYEIEERNHHMSTQYWGGYSRHNEIWRLVRSKSTQEQIAEEFVTRNDAMMMYAPFLDQTNATQRNENLVCEE